MFSEKVIEEEKEKEKEKEKQRSIQQAAAVPVKSEVPDNGAVAGTASATSAAGTPAPSAQAEKAQQKRLAEEANTRKKRVQFLESEIPAEKQPSANIKVKPLLAFGSQASLNLLFDEEEEESESEEIETASEQKSRMKVEAIAQGNGRHATTNPNPIQNPSPSPSPRKNSPATAGKDQKDLTSGRQQAALYSTPSRGAEGVEYNSQYSAELEEDARLTRLSSVLLLCVLLIAGMCCLFDDTLTVMYRGGNGVHRLLQAHGYDGHWRPHKESLQRAHDTVRTHRYVPKVLTGDAWMEQTGLRNSPSTEFAIHIISPGENDIVTETSNPMLDVELTGEALLQSYYRAASSDSGAAGAETIAAGERERASERHRLTEMNASFVVRIDGWELNFTSGSHIMVPLQQSSEPLHIKLNLRDYDLADGVHLLDVAVTLHNSRHTNMSSSSVALLERTLEHSDSRAMSSVAFFYLSDPQQFARRYQYLSQRVAAGEGLGDALVAPHHKLSPEDHSRANAGDTGRKSPSNHDNNSDSSIASGSGERMQDRLVSAEFPPLPEEILTITSPLNNFTIPEQLGEKASLIVYARVRPSAILSAGAVMHLVFDGQPYDISADVRAQISPATTQAASTENRHLDKGEFATFSVNISGFVREASHSVQLALTFEHATQRMTFTTQVVLSSEAIDSSSRSGVSSKMGDGDMQQAEIV